MALANNKFELLLLLTWQFVAFTSGDICPFKQGNQLNFISGGFQNDKLMLIVTNGSNTATKSEWLVYEMPSVALDRKAHRLALYNMKPFAVSLFNWFPLFVVLSNSLVTVYRTYFVNYLFTGATKQSLIMDLNINPPDTQSLNVTISYSYSKDSPQYLVNGSVVDDRLGGNPFIQLSVFDTGMTYAYASSINGQSKVFFYTFNPEPTGQSVLTPYKTSLDVVTLCKSSLNELSFAREGEKCNPLGWPAFQTGMVDVNHRFYLFGPSDVYIFEANLLNRSVFNAHFVVVPYTDFFVCVKPTQPPSTLRPTNATDTSDGKSPLTLIIVIVVIVIVVLCIIVIIWLCCCFGDKQDKEKENGKATDKKMDKTTKKKKSTEKEKNKTTDKKSAKDSKKSKKKDRSAKSGKSKKSSKKKPSASATATANKFKTAKQNPKLKQPTKTPKSDKFKSAMSSSANAVSMRSGQLSSMKMGKAKWKMFAPPVTAKKVKGKSLTADSSSFQRSVLSKQGDSKYSKVSKLGGTHESVISKLSASGASKQLKVSKLGGSHKSVISKVSPSSSANAKRATVDEKSRSFSSSKNRSANISKSSKQGPQKGTKPAKHSKSTSKSNLKPNSKSSSTSSKK